MNILFPLFVGGRGAVGFLVLRLVAGSALMLHGWPKIQHAFSWMGEQAPVPGFLQALAALAEFGGGICWMLGVLTPVFSFLVICTMGTAMGMVHLPKGHPFIAKGPGEPSYELALVYLAIALALLLTGPGRLSLDAAFFAPRRNDGGRIGRAD